MHHDPDGLLLVRDADVGLRHARLCVARARAAARTLRSARPRRIIGWFVFGRPWTVPVQVMTKVVVENMRPPTQPVRQARPNLPNVSTRSHTQTRSGRTVASLRSPSRPEGAESASPRRVFSHESTRNSRRLCRERFDASDTARQAGFPERFVEVMTACWDSGSSRSRRPPCVSMRAPNPSCRRKAATHGRTIHGQ